MSRGTSLLGALEPSSQKNLFTKRVAHQSETEACEHVEGKADEFRKSVLWFDETKLELFGHTDVAYVWQRKGEAFNHKSTVPTVKHGGGSIML